MPDLVTYGDTTVSFPFRITLNGAPVDLTIDTDIVDGDVKLFKDGAHVRSVDVSAEITKISNGSHVYYEWAPPNTSDVQAADYAVLTIEDISAGGEFDANMIILYTGGNASARFSG